ncbi:MAG: hypothetical protein R6V01_10145 [Thermoplasmatota archaeon]
MKGYRTAVAYCLALMMTSLMLHSPVVSSQTVVEVGEPLHLYIRRMPVQDMTYLHFYPPDDELIGDNFSYRKTLQQKDTPGDSFRMFYPQSRESNFLQFEPNSSVRFYYHFVVSGQVPLATITVKPIYRIKVLIELDYEHDDVYDREITLEITGTAGQGPEVKEGNIPIDTSELKRFKGDTGGRIRVNISRQDSLSSVVTIYCGTGGHHSWFRLPYSKYKYEGESENGSSTPMIVVLLAILIFTAIAVSVLLYKDAQQKKKKEMEKEKGRKSRRRK